MKSWKRAAISPSSSSRRLIRDRLELVHERVQLVLRPAARRTLRIWNARSARYRVADDIWSFVSARKAPKPSFCWRFASCSSAIWSIRSPYLRASDESASMAFWNRSWLSRRRAMITGSSSPRICPAYAFSELLSSKYWFSRSRAFATSGWLSM